MNANITVLKDESLGGVEREYREVKRKASVGELVKMYDYAHGQNGEILKVRESKGGAEQFEGKRDGHGSPQYITGRGNGGHVYTTLEPTDTVRIYGERFRMVDRKAAVGERVIVTDVIDNYGFFSRGNIGIYKGDNWVDFNDQDNVGYDTDDGEWAVGDNNGRSEYRVLEPVESAQQLEPLSAKPAPDQAAEIIAKLAGRVTALEKRVAALETAPINPRFSDVGVTVQVATDAFVKVAQRTSVTVAEVTANLAQRAKEARQRKRDDIVKRAKEDVADLRKFAGMKVPNDYVSFWPQSSRPTSYTPLHKVEYVVNREKRTVVALIRRPEGDSITRGIAKCAPGDVFNVWLGKAIALRHALGLEIPEEYVSAPQPTEVRVGDIVTYQWVRAYGTQYRVLTLEHGGPNLLIVADGDSGMLGDYAYGGKEVASAAIILDDSRESGSAEPRKEVV